MKVIGIDIGTTTVSAVVLEPDGHDGQKLLTSRTIANGSFLKGADWERIQDAEKLTDKAKAVLDELLAAYPETEAIGLTGQMHGIVYTDREGRAVSPLYTWEDGRGDQREFDGETAASWIRKNCGIPAATGFGLVTHFYQSRKKQVPESAVSMGTISDYFAMKLTGRKKPLVHASNAASIGFYDTKQRCFCEDKIRLAEMDPAILPDTANEMEAVGSYQGIPVTVALGDNQASFLGSVGIQEQVWQLNVGTGGQLSVLSHEHFETEGIEARPFLHGAWILTGAILCAGRAYACLEKFFRSCAEALGVEECSCYAMMAELAGKAAADADGFRVTTLFQGTRTYPELRGHIEGISENNFLPENLTMGVIQGIAREYYELYQVIHEGTGLEARVINGSGNGLRKNLFLQKAISDMFKAPLILTDLQEEGASGAALSAALYLHESAGR